MLILGIDPGVSGAIAELRDGRLARVHPMPTFTTKGTKRVVDEDGLARIIRSAVPDHAYIEQVNSRPGEGHAGAFAFGRSYGVPLGVLAGLGVGRTPVAPVTWKASLRVPADKDGARARASQLMPYAAHLWPRKMDDGLAEAALIALYGHGLGVAKNSIQW